MKKNYKTINEFFIGGNYTSGILHKYNGTPGIPDGIGAWKKGANVKLVVNSELVDSRGYPYMLANGTVLTGHVLIIQLCILFTPPVV